MSKQQLKAVDTDGFMLAVWDSWVDLAEEFDVTIGVGAALSKERGVMVFRASAYRMGADGLESRVATAERRWPGHQYSQVHALLYSLLIGLWRELNEERRQRELQAAPALPKADA